MRRIDSMPAWRKTLVRNLRRNRTAARILARLALVSRYGFPAEVGWLESSALRRPVDARGEPIPWMTYGIIRFLEDRMRPELRVFEYGMGNSTLWWAARVSAVVSCEWDRRWYDQITASMPDNVTPLLEPDVDSGKYAASVLGRDEPFDIIVVDGRDRSACARNAVRRLSPDGVIIWDNTDRPRYQTVLDSLLADGFRRIDFFGLGPVNASPEQSSILYRPDNCLGI